MSRELTAEERKSCAEQLLANPLWADLFSKIERDATEDMIFAPDEETRADLAKRVQAIRNLRSDCEAQARSTRPRKSAPA